MGQGMAGHGRAELQVIGGGPGREVRVTSLAPLLGNKYSCDCGRGGGFWLVCSMCVACVA